MTHRPRAHRRDDAGIAVVWLGLMITVIIAMAGFAADFGQWYLTASRVQNATDAAALGGVVFMPHDFDGAEDVAEELLAGYGYVDPSTITIEPGDSNNQLRVTVSETVINTFGGAIGVGETTIERTALAEFLGPVPLGSPDNQLGNDPDRATQPDFWLNVAGPASTKISGDRYAAKVCPDTVARCDDDQDPDNLDYSEPGYFFTMHVDEPTGDDLVVQLFDGLMAYVGDKCTVGTWPTAAQLTTLAGLNPARFGDAATRYVAGHTGAQAEFCSGDMDIAGSNVQTTIIVREPDETPWLTADNPVIDVNNECEPTRLPSFTTTGTNRLYRLLHPSDGQTDAEGIFNQDDGTLTFAELFRQWATVCTIPADDVVAGDYLIQIRTNASSADLTEYDATVNTGGHNRFSMRTGWETDTSWYTPPASDGVTLHARGRLPIYANADDANTTFYLARVTEKYRGRHLNVVLYDAGDAASAGKLQVLPPEEATVEAGNLDVFTGCSFFRNDGATLTTDPDLCRLRNVSSGAGYNGRLVEIVTPIPEDYDCDEDDPNGCWIKVLADFPGGVNDTTTWSAEIIGDPVRLIE